MSQLNSSDCPCVHFHPEQMGWCDPKCSCMNKLNQCNQLCCYEIVSLRSQVIWLKICEVFVLFYFFFCIVFNLHQFPSAYHWRNIVFFFGSNAGHTVAVLIYPVLKQVWLLCHYCRVKGCAWSEQINWCLKIFQCRCESNLLDANQQST